MYGHMHSHLLDKLNIEQLASTSMSYDGLLPDRRSALGYHGSPLEYSNRDTLVTICGNALRFHNVNTKEEVGANNL